MEEYIVSARKYRPLTFDSVVGQRALTTTLQNAIASGKLAHAYLFCGPRGVGKTTCARIFAKAINCMQPASGGDACGECESCRAFNEGRSMNIHELDAASNNSVEDIRELCKQVLIPPQIGRYKVFIIDEVHMLSQAAFNAFLKTLEEPPHYVIFILATTEKHKILPTILSRCQVYDFQRMTTQGTIDHLRYVAEKEGYVAAPEALNLIAQKADGGMRDALSIFDQMVSFTGGQLTLERVSECLNVLSLEYYFRLVDHALRGEIKESLLLLDEVLLKGFEGGNFISGLASHLRDLLVSIDAQTLPLLEMSDQMRQRYQEQASRCKPQFLYRALKLCNECDQSYRTSHNKRLQVEICLIQVAQLEEDVPGSGLCPEQIIKPIFSAMPQQVAGAVATAPVQTATGAERATSPAAAQVQVAATHTATSHATPRATSHIETNPTPSRPLKLFSLRRGQQTATAEKPTETTSEHRALTEEGVEEAWHELVRQLPREYDDLAQRLRAVRPAIEEGDVLHLTVSNPYVEGHIRQHEDMVLARLRLLLQNGRVTFSYSIRENQETVVMSNAEVFRQLLNTHAQLRQLAVALDLSLV